jgi:hypothetical protein
MHRWNAPVINWQYQMAGVVESVVESVVEGVIDQLLITLLTI